MARIFITGSSDGLGSLAAQALVKKGHTVVLHARSSQRAKDAQNACPGAETCLVADLLSITETKKLAEEVNKLGDFDAVVHNAGLYRGGFKKTEDGLPSIIAVNTIAPYILTCLINSPKRLVYLSSGLHSGGDATLKDLTFSQRGERGYSDGQAYADSKLHNIMMAKAIARKWPNVLSNSMDPGWQPTKMGGSNAPGDLNAAVETYVLLAEDTDATGKYFRPGRMEASPKAASDSTEMQDRLLKICEEITGVAFP